MIIRIQQIQIQKTNNQAKNSRMFHPRQLQLQSQIPQFANDEDPLLSGSHLDANHNSIINHNQQCRPRNRRELKLEKEELTALFSELISVINHNVCYMDEDRDKMPRMLFEMKGKAKSSKEKREETKSLNNSQKLGNSGKRPQQIQVLEQIKAYKFGTKQQIFSNYNKIMEYKIRDESLVKENDKLAAVPVATNEWQKLASKGNKEFSVVQEISLIVNTVRDRI